MYRRKNFGLRLHKHSTEKLLMALSITLALYSVYHHVYAQSVLNNSELRRLNISSISEGHNLKSVPVEDKWSFYILILGLITILVTASTVATDMVLKSQEWKNERNDTINVILNELQENKKALLSNVHSRINYVIEDSQLNIKEINYINAYLELDAYESVLHSGLIKHLPIDIQSRLTMLYSRIRSRNELIAYTNRFEDMFFIYDDSQERLNRWYKKIQKYDILLTQWEAEIIDLLEETERKVHKKRSEVSKSHKYIFMVRYPWQR
jgi:hypothetical protein